jgi:hypothetical protein
MDNRLADADCGTLASMASKKKPRGRSRERGRSVVFGFEMEPELDAALERFAKVDRRTKKTIVTMALEQFLERAGHWPPAD